MLNAELLNSQKHQTLRVDLEGPIPQSKITRNSFVLMQEFAHLLLQYPIMLTKNRETGRFTCVAVLGFDEGENLFIEDGNWQALYIPLNVQREPFMIGVQPDSTGSDGIEQVVFVDTDDPRVQATKGEALFDEQGRPSPYLGHVTALLKTLNDGIQQTQTFIDKLISLDLVAPAHLRVELSNKEERRIEGLYTIDRERLQSLPAKELHELNTSGYLEAAHNLLASFGQFHALVARKNRRISESLERS